MRKVPMTAGGAVALRVELNELKSKKPTSTAAAVRKKRLQKKKK